MFTSCRELDALCTAPARLMTPRRRPPGGHGRPLHQLPRSVSLLQTQQLLVWRTIGAVCLRKCHVFTYLSLTFFKPTMKLHLLASYQLPKSQKYLANSNRLNKKPCTKTKNYLNTCFNINAKSLVGLNE